MSAHKRRSQRPASSQHKKQVLGWKFRDSSAPAQFPMRWPACPSGLASYGFDAGTLSFTTFSVKIARSVVAACVAQLLRARTAVEEALVARNARFSAFSTHRTLYLSSDRRAAATKVLSVL